MQKMSASVEKSEIQNMKSWLVPLSLLINVTSKHSVWKIFVKRAWERKTNKQTNKNKTKQQKQTKTKTKTKQQKQTKTKTKTKQNKNKQAITIYKIKSYKSFIHTQDSILAQRVVIHIIAPLMGEDTIIWASVLTFLRVRKKVPLVIFSS